MFRTAIAILFVLITCCSTAQNQKRWLFEQIGFQCMSPCYFSFGLGYQSGDPIIPVRKQNSKYNFNGFILSYNRSIQENNYGKRDWGTSLQYAIYSFGKNLPFVTAVEANYKSVSHKKHFGIKPGVGFTYKCFNLVYGYNFDFNKNPEQRISQHEILLSYWFKLEI